MRLSNASNETDAEEAYEKADKKRRKDMKDCWKYVRTLRDTSSDRVFYECAFCRIHLSLRNPHDSVANHMVLSCQKATW
jgi:hypothetical protein